MVRKVNSSAAQLQRRGTLLVALSGLLFGLMGFLGTQLFYLHFTVENMLFWRFLVATAWISLGAVLSKKQMLWKTDSAMSLMKIFILSAFSYSGATAFYFLASQHIGTGFAMVIFFSFPVFVTLLAWILGTWKMNRFSFAALVAVISGLALIKVSGGNVLDGAGIALAVIAACCFAAYVYGSQHTTKNIDSRILTLLVCFGNTIIFLVLSCYTSSIVVPHSIKAWFYICSIGIIATALPIQLLLDGLKYISPVKASILSALEPVVTVMVGLILLHETISYWQSLGITIILLGAILIQFERA